MQKKEEGGKIWFSVNPSSHLKLVSSYALLGGGLAR
jgi:hypothetical protein